VTVLAGGVTNLEQDDVFYFGHAAAETGNLPDDFRVDGADVLLVERNFTASASIDNPYDFDRDGHVDAGDVELARDAINAPWGDLDRDDVVGWLDLSRLQAGLGNRATAGYYEGDLTGDGFVNRADAALLARSYGQVTTGAMLAARLHPITPRPSPRPAPSAAAPVVETSAISNSPPRRSNIRVVDDGAADAVLAARERTAPVETRVMRTQADGVRSSPGQPVNTISASRQRVAGPRRHRPVIHDRLPVAAADQALLAWGGGDLG
jgi:hypothetical protein